MHHICAMLVEARGRCVIHWKWSHRQLPTVIWVLGTETGTSARVVSALNQRAISPVLCIIVFKVCFKVAFIYVLEGVWGCRCTCALVHTWRSEDSCLESVLFFHHMCPRDRTQVVKFGSKGIYHWAFSSALCVVVFKFRLFTTQWHDHVNSTVGYYDLPFIESPLSSIIYWSHLYYMSKYIHRGSLKEGRLSCKYMSSVLHVLDPKLLHSQFPFFFCFVENTPRST